MNTTLYFGRSGNDLGFSAHREIERLSDGTYRVVRDGAPAWAKDHRIVVLSDPAAAAAFVTSHPVDALVLDTRDSAQLPWRQSRVGALLALLFPEDESFGGPVPRARVLGIVGQGGHASECAFALGGHRVAEVLSDPPIGTVLDRLDALYARAVPGRIALCLAGGGIEGMLYELGVLRALGAFLANRPVVDLDLFCGISAGAVLGAFLANGIGPDEIARGLSGGSARFDAMKRSDLFDPNYKEVMQRALRLAGDLVRGGRGPRGAVSSVTRAIPSAVFAGDNLRAWLEAQLTKPGMKNDFRQLRRPLLVGATDQDTSEAVLFGTAPLEHVPVHRAVRASSALSPFYKPECIDGRYYIDGAFSRTTNMRVAVDHGATLVILVDPLVPVASSLPGYVQERGAIYSTMQGLKALINGRFDKAVRAIREMYPDVSFYLFRPEEDERRILSGSPMKYFYRTEIEEMAYHASVKKMREWLPEMTRDFARHGVTFRDPEVDRPANTRSGYPVPPGELGVGI